MSKTKKRTVSVRLNQSTRAFYTWEEFDELLYKYEQRGFIRGLRSAARKLRREHDWGPAQDIDRHASRLERKMRGAK